MLDFDKLEQYREDHRIEAKQALGGLPESIWETYSAFANSQGGIILLGVEELEDKSLHALDILDPQWLIEDFWNLIENREVVNRNILSREHLQTHEIDGKTIISITVPKSDSLVYIGTDPYTGAYQRLGEGDYRLPKEEIVKRLQKEKMSSPG